MLAYPSECGIDVESCQGRIATEFLRVSALRLTASADVDREVVVVILSQSLDEPSLFPSLLVAVAAVQHDEHRPCTAARVRRKPVGGDADAVVGLERDRLLVKCSVKRDVGFVRKGAAGENETIEPGEPDDPTLDDEDDFFDEDDEPAEPPSPEVSLDPEDSR